MTDTEKTWQVDPKVRFRRIFEEAVVVHQERAEALVLNEVGASFLELCDGERSVQQIIDLMLGQYDTGAEVLSEDIHEFILELYDSGIITPRSLGV